MMENISLKWSAILKTNKENIKDQRRNKNLSSLILHFNTILIKKLELGNSYSNFSEGNFSLSPFYENYEKILPINQKIIEDILKYLEEFLTINDKLFQSFSLLRIQISLAISVIDEEYCLISLLAHLFSAYKLSTNFLAFNVYEKELKISIDNIENRFEKCFRIAKNFFEKCRVMKEFSDIKNLIPLLSEEVLKIIRNITILKKDNPENFNIFDLLNNRSSIYDLKIPLSYGKAVKNIKINEIIGN